MAEISKAFPVQTSSSHTLHLERNVQIKLGVILTYVWFQLWRFYCTANNTGTLSACSNPMSGWLNISTRRLFHSPEEISCWVSSISTAIVYQGYWGAEGRTSREFGAVVPAVSHDSRPNTPPPPVCWYSGLWGSLAKRRMVMAVSWLCVCNK